LPLLFLPRQDTALFGESQGGFGPKVLISVPAHSPLPGTRPEEEKGELYRAAAGKATSTVSRLIEILTIIDYNRFTFKRVSHYAWSLHAKRAALD
jgi:hypothetical protein